MNQLVKMINLGAVNCYLFKTNAGFILIDSGGMTVFDRDLLKIRKNLDDELRFLGCNSSNLKLVIITHGDTDHTGNCLFLQKQYNAKIAIHKNDFDRAKTGIMPKRVVKPLIKKIIMNLIGFNESQYKKIDQNYEKFIPDIIINENFDLMSYDFKAKIIHIPGHTSGSIGILTDNGDFFCGDMFGVFNKPDVSPFIENYDDLKNSLNIIKKLNIKTVYPGHGKPFDISLFYD